MKKIPYRMCIVTREKFPKKELIRVVKDKDNNIFVDEVGKANGRGVYLKKDIDVINKAIKNKSIDRALEVSIPDTIYEKLKSIVEE